MATQSVNDANTVDRGYDIALYAVRYTRDTLGRIAEKSETIGGATHVYDYDYDLAGRLTDVLTDGTASAHYDYDANSNRIGGFNQQGSLSSAQYDDQDRLLTLDVGLSTLDFSYTANGELLTKTDASGTTTYTYDVLGNLTAVTLPDGTQIEYVIDGKNRRIGKKVNGTVVQEWLYDGQLRIVAELDGSGNVVSRFVYGEKPNVPEYIVRGGVIYRLIPDHLGSPRLVVNVADGTIAQRVDYDEFGNVLLDTNPGFQPFGFAGGLHDRDTKLVRFGARDYDPQTGRWSAKDPIRFDAGDTNLYGYVVNDPVNSVDLKGERGLPAPGALALGFLAYRAMTTLLAQCNEACLQALKAGPNRCVFIPIPLLSGPASPNGPQFGLFAKVCSTADGCSGSLFFGVAPAPDA